MYGYWQKSFGKVVRGAMVSHEKVWSAIRSYAPNDSIDKDKHHEGIRQREVKKYLRESCYHRIKSSAANSLAALMWM